MPGYRSQLDWIGTTARMVWATDELLRGRTPYRRLLGAVLVLRPAHRLYRQLSLINDKE
jgi:hypothetical protein